MESGQNSRAALPQPEVVVTWPDFDAGDAGPGGELRRAGFALRFEPKRGRRSPLQVAHLLRDAVAAIVSTDPFDAAAFSLSPHLRVIARVGVGTDSIDLNAATAAGVVVTITPGANEVTVADHTLALMLAVLRRVVELDASVRNGDWNRTGRYMPWTLSGATVGIVGYGRTGRLVADRLRGFGSRVLVADPHLRRQEEVEHVGLETLLAESDVVSLHLPLTPQTRHLIGAEELALMSPSAVFVNCARGGLVDERALIDALASGRLRGAGLDVFFEEPPRSRALTRLPNVVLSPHVAGLSEQSVDEMTRRAAVSVIDVISGRCPCHMANPQALQHSRYAEFPLRAAASSHA